MPLIECPVCGRAISTDAEACPQCGHPRAPAPKALSIEEHVRRFQIVRGGHYFWGRITAVPSRPVVPMLVQGYGCVRFLFPGMGLPFLKWKRLSGFQIARCNVNVWSARFSDHAQSVTQWAAIERPVAGLYKLLAKNELWPGKLSISISYELTFGGFRITRGLVIDFRVSGMVNSLLDQFTEGAQELCDALMRLTTDARGRF